MIRHLIVFQLCFALTSAVSLGAGADHQESPTPTGSPISREQLAAIMKHPTEPHFDLLRPMSGRWVRCLTNGAEPTSGSIQDRFSSSDRAHFSRTELKASDDSCKTVLSESRTNYECTPAGETTLTCKVVKKESKVGDGAWAPVKLSDADLSNQAIKLAFLGLEKKSRHKSKRLSKIEDEFPADSQPGNGRTLELRIEPEVGGPADSIHLDFSPVTPHAKKRSATTDS